MNKAVAIASKIVLGFLIAVLAFLLWLLSRSATQHSMVHPLERISATDIERGKVRIIGRLGKPIGDKVKVTFETPKEWQKDSSARVLSIDDMPVATYLMISIARNPYAASDGEKFPPIELSRRYTVIGYETAGYESSPGWIWQRPVSPPPGTPAGQPFQVPGDSLPMDMPAASFGFRVHFIVVLILAQSPLPQ